MKKCKKCGVDKEISMFYVNKTTSDGRFGTCKSCLSLYWREFNKKPHRKKALKKYNNTPAGVKSHNVGSKNYSKKHPERILAVNILNRAVYSEEVERGLCEVCGERKTEAHHDDYSKPLDVRWLCKKHHNELHKKERVYKHNITEVS